MTINATEILKQLNSGTLVSRSAVVEMAQELERLQQPAASTGTKAMVDAAHSVWKEYYKIPKGATWEAPSAALFMQTYMAMHRAAPPVQVLEDELRSEGRLRAMSDVSALLPSTYYMDPPDGGSVTVLEQVERMAKDAKRYRWLLHNYAIGDGYNKIDAALNDGEADRLLSQAIDAAITATKE